MNSKEVFVFVLYILISALAVCYFSEHDREVLLFGVYPAIVLCFLGLVAWVEKK